LNCLAIRRCKKDEAGGQHCAHEENYWGEDWRNQEWENGGASNQKPEWQ
jgi:hypothetical protein